MQSHAYMAEYLNNAFFILQYRACYLTVCFDRGCVLPFSRMTRKSLRVVHIVGGHYRIVCPCQCPSLHQLKARRRNLAMHLFWAPLGAPQSSPPLCLPQEPVQSVPPFSHHLLPPLAFFEMSRSESPKEKAKRSKVTRCKDAYTMIFNMCELMHYIEPHFGILSSILNL